MSRKQFHFLSPNTGVTGSPANRKVAATARSEARSHAAKVSYPPQHRIKRRTLSSNHSQDNSILDQSQEASEDSQSDGYSDISSPESAISSNGNVTQDPRGYDSNQPLPSVNLRFKQYEIKDRLKKKGARKGPLSPAKVPMTISRSTLDPFISPAVHLSVPDEHLLHLYLSTVPDELYGKSSGSASEVVREGTLGVVATNDIVLMWLLLTVESQVVSFQPSKTERQLSILARRAQAYKLMKERLNSEASSSLDFAFTVAVAASCEIRMANAPGAEQHIGAVKKLLSLQGGSKAVRDITYPLGLMVVNILVEQGIPSLFDCREDLRAKLKSMVQRLRDYQAWNYSLRSDSSPPSPMSIQSCLTPSPDEDEPLSPSLDGLRRRVHAFDTDSALGKYIALPANEPDDATYRFLLSVLYALNTAFWDFRDSPNMSNGYLAELVKSVELSKAANFVLRAGGSKLPSLLMLMMLAHKAAADEGRNASTSIVFHDEEIFEFVNLIMMGGSVIRLRVLKALSSWLTTAAQRVNDLVRLEGFEFDILAKEVEGRWVSDQARRLANMQLS